MTPIERQFLIESLCEDLVPMLMDEYGFTSDEAMDTLYRSQTFAKVENPNTGLYYQGSVYVYDYLKEEISSPSLE